MIYSHFQFALGVTEYGVKLQPPKIFQDYNSVAQHWDDIWELNGS